MKGPLWKRLPLVLALLGALFFWRGGFGLLPVERSITWRLWGDFATIRSVEVQLYDGDELLQRSVVASPSGATFEPVTRVQLRRGTYRGVVMVYRADAGAPEVHDQPLQVDEASAVVTVP